MEALLHLQGDPESDLAPLFLIHAISGLALPYLALGSLTDDGRPIYGISSPIYEFKGYSPPSSLDTLAAEYVSLIRREVQPHGPYLLGGWSMGGMISMRMAALLESQGEKVLHVVLIDSANPDNIPPFADTNEHTILTSLTFSHVSQGLGMPSTPSLNRNNSDSSFSSSSSSQECLVLPNNPGTATPDSEISSEEELFDCDDEYEDDFAEDDDDAVSMLEWPARMRKHIFNGLSLIACKGSRSKYGTVSAPVTLIKCSTLKTLPPLLSEARRRAIQKTFRDSNSGWKLAQMRTMLISSAHDHVLDPEHAEELTRALRNALKSVKC